MYILPHTALRILRFTGPQTHYLCVEAKEGLQAEMDTCNVLHWLILNNRLYARDQ
jgi:hypothetical protein